MRKLKLDCSGKTPRLEDVVPVLPDEDGFVDIRHLVWGGGKRTVAICSDNENISQQPAITDKEL